MTPVIRMIYRQRSVQIQAMSRDFLSVYLLPTRPILTPTVQEQCIRMFAGEKRGAGFGGRLRRQRRHSGARRHFCAEHAEPRSTQRVRASRTQFVLAVTPALALRGGAVCSACSKALGALRQKNIEADLGMVHFRDRGGATTDRRDLRRVGWGFTSWRRKPV